MNSLSSLFFSASAVSLALIAPTAAQETAYTVNETTAGNQNYGGSLGMDFSVNHTITVTELGVFDDESNGLALTITAALFSRNDNGTPDDPSDDTGGEILAEIEFTPDDGGALSGGHRFKPLTTVVELQPGTYTIAAWGYGDDERNGNGFGAGGFGETAEGIHLTFTGMSRYGDAGGFPATVDGGPANRYGAGSFRYNEDLVDTDSDGWDDRYEMQLFGGLTQSPTSDADGDGLSNQAEIDADTNPNLADTDGDLLDDAAETGTGTFIDADNTGTDPLLADSDGDGLQDGTEVTGPGTDPNNADSDGDGAGDGEEIAASTDPLDANSRPETFEVALHIDTGTAGNQGFGGALGMDFIVTSPIEVRELGVFDDGSNGLARTLKAEIWTREDGGTPEDTADDTGGTVVVSAEFTTADPGFQRGGSRFKPLNAPLELAPGAYTIVAQGYGGGELNGNSGGNGEFSTPTSSGAVVFVGTSRYGTDPASYPDTPDGGPAGRYGAGTFSFLRVQTDSDNDGFEDKVETALGSDPANAGSVPRGNAVYLVRNGVTWDQADAWSDGMVPSAGKSYYVIDGVANQVAAPAGENVVFGGDSLTIIGNLASLLLDGSAAEVEIPDLRLQDLASIAHTADDTAVKLTGGLQIGQNGAILLLTGGNRSLEIAGRLSGQSNLVASQALEAPGGSIVVSGDNNAFTGDWEVLFTTLRGTVLNALGEGSITVGSGMLDVDYNINNPQGILTLTSDMSVVKLDQDHVFGTFILGTIDIGAAIGTGTYTREDLINAVDPLLAANFTDDGGSITIGGDTDGDELLDSWERDHFGGLTEDGTGDTDGDGLNNITEFGLGSDPNKVDTDGDGLGDSEEQALGTDPAKTDSDDDGLADNEETVTDPLDADSDDDGLTDGQEVTETMTDPNNADSDGDGASDGVEVATQTDPLDAGSVAAVAAYVVSAGVVGNQEFTGALGMDFNVLAAVDVTELGVFDSGSDGLALDITVGIWSRNDSGTPDNPADDTPGELLVSMVFTEADSGALDGGSRFKLLDKPLRLEPGSYAVVAAGYGPDEPNGNLGASELAISTDMSGFLEFTGNAHWGDDPAAYPPNQDSGPANRYAAGTFKFLKSGGPPVTTNDDFQIESVARLTDKVELHWSSIEGETYRVETSADAASWIPIASGLDVTNFTHDNPDGESRFYRIATE